MAFPILPGMDFQWLDPEGTPNRRWRAVMPHDVWQKVVNLRLYGSEVAPPWRPPVLAQKAAQTDGPQQKGRAETPHQKTPDAPQPQGQGDCGRRHSTPPATVTLFSRSGGGRTGAGFDNPRLQQSKNQNTQTMKISKKSNSFENCPEYTGPAVCVDVTEPRKVETGFGPKEVFKVVFETQLVRDDGTPYCVWSRSFTASVHEKAALTQFLRKWMGRPLSEEEEAEFDTESLLGKTAEITVIHEEGRNGETYANIALIRPDRSAKPMKPSGKFVRQKDRANKDAQYRRTSSESAHDDADHDGASSTPEAAAPDWQATKVHVGKHEGLDLGDLDRDSVLALLDKWLPGAVAAPKKTAADRRLIAALEAARNELDTLAF